MDAATYLNELFAADPNAIHALMVNRVPCNTALTDHEFCIVDNAPVLGKEYFAVGTLGLINGMLAANGQSEVAMAFSDTTDAEGRHKFIGFSRVNEFVSTT